MEKFVSYTKLSKKAKKERDQMQRQTWGVFNPVTRRTINKKKSYKREKFVGIDEKEAI